MRLINLIYDNFMLAIELGPEAGISEIYLNQNWLIPVTLNTGNSIYVKITPIKVKNKTTFVCSPRNKILTSEFY